MSFPRELASILLKLVAVVVGAALILFLIDNWYTETAISDGLCNIAVLPIEGVILPFADFEESGLYTTPSVVRDFVSSAENDLAIEGILLEINSPGGTPVASEQISEIIQETTLPTMSLIGDMAASGAYLVAASADSVVASAMSDVGSIGVTMSYLENSKQNEEDGLTFVELSTGKFKDAGNPNKPLSDEERALFEADLEVVHDLFVKRIAEARGVSTETIEALADGASMPGVRALEKGLVDTLGGRNTARKLFAESLQKEESEIVFCEYYNETLLF